MKNGLLADIVLYDKLTPILSRVYPIVAENSTQYPFIIYTRDSVTPHALTKDGYAEDEVAVTVKVVHYNYAKCVYYAQKVRKALTYDWTTTNYTNDDTTDTITSQCTFTNAFESWEENAYVQTLTFTMLVA